MTCESRKTCAACPGGGSDRRDSGQASRSQNAVAGADRGYDAAMVETKSEDNGLVPKPAPPQAIAGSRWRMMAQVIFWSVMTIVGCAVTTGVIVAGLYPRISTLLECGSVSSCYR
jgi:hypothetical protein